MKMVKLNTQNSKVFHEGKEQGLSLMHEAALNQRGIISHVGDNLDCAEYIIVQGYSWADVDSVISEVNASDKCKFEYQLLGRLQQDCEYYLGAGDGNKKHLWALDETLQIQKMKELYESLPVKPNWITLEAINGYEEKMVQNKI